jgi:hypothetical protein
MIAQQAMNIEATVWQQMPVPTIVKNPGLARVLV